MFLKKKRNFPVEKKFWPFPSRINEHDKRQETIYKGPQGTLTITVEGRRSFIQDLTGCCKQKFLNKKAIFPVRKRFWPIFSRNTNGTNIKGHIKRVHKVF